MRPLRSSAALAAAFLLLGLPRLAAQGAPPGGVAVAGAQGAVTVSWSVIRDETVMFRVLRAKDAKAPGENLTEKMLGYSVNSFVDATAVQGATYYYQVVAVYGGKVEAPSPMIPYLVPAFLNKGAGVTPPIGVAPPLPLKAPVPGMTGQFNLVTLSWTPVTPAVGETISYVVRRFTVDPATVPAGTTPGYVTGNPTGPAAGPITIVDRSADLHLPTWYKVVATSTTRGSAESGWYRRDPPLHRGVDTIIGSYWREVVPQGTKTLIHWTACFKISAVPGAGTYGARVRVAAGNWVTISMPVPGQSSSAAMNHAPWFDTQYPQYAALLQPLENGGQPQVQAWPMFTTTGSNYGPFAADTAHLTPVVYTFASSVPLNPVTCGALPPPPPPPPPPLPPPPPAAPIDKGAGLSAITPTAAPAGTNTSTLSAATTPAPGPAPANVTVTGTPAQAHVSWQLAPGASGYTISRSKQNDPCCKAESGTLAANVTSWSDLVQWSGQYTYRVTAIYPAGAGFPAGRLGTVDVTYAYPEPQTPQQFKAVQSGDGTVVLSWLPVKDATSYIVGGPPTNVAFKVTGTTTTITGVPAGSRTWQVATSYEPAGGGEPRAGSTFVMVTTNVLAWTGKYRVIAQAIRADHTTGDAPKVEDVITFNSRNDGAGDEVYLTSVAQTLNRSNHYVLQDFPILVSAVHGDVSAFPQDQRARAGTASANGGLQQNDMVNPVLGVPAAGAQGWPLFVLWEGDLTNGKEDLILHPQLWDADEPDAYLSRLVRPWCSTVGVACASDALSNWGNYILHTGNSTFVPEVQAALASPQISIAAGNVIWIESDPYLRHLENQDKDRPIGLENDGTGPPTFGVTGRLRDLLVVLNREKIEAALASGNGVINVRMWDHWAMPGAAPSANTQQGGDYTLMLRVERVP